MGGHWLTSQMNMFFLAYVAEPGFQAGHCHSFWFGGCREGPRRCASSMWMVKCFTSHHRGDASGQGPWERGVLGGG